MDQAAAERLAQHPFLVELATRMKTRIVTRVEPALATMRGRACHDADLRRRSDRARDADAAAQIEWLLRERRRRSAGVADACSLRRSAC